jgi:hypothetical protein
MADDALPSTGGTTDDKGWHKLEVIVRPMPKVIFFYPVWIVSLACMLFPAEWGDMAGQLWMGVFALNLLVISADFNEERSLIVVLLLAVAVVVTLWLDALGPVLRSLGAVKPNMNRTFYASIFGLFTLIYLFVWIRSYFDYWIFRPTELVHRTGFFPKMKRYSTESMRWQKEIPDVLERVMASSGRLVMSTPQETHPIIIEHVLGISSKDDQISRLLGVRRVVSESTS